MFCVSVCPCFCPMTTMTTKMKQNDPKTIKNLCQNRLKGSANGNNSNLFVKGIRILFDNSSKRSEDNLTEPKRWPHPGRLIFLRNGRSAKTTVLEEDQTNWVYQALSIFIHAWVRTASYACTQT